MKIVAGLIIDKKILSKEAIETQAKDIETYISHVDKLVILNTTGHQLTEFLKPSAGTKTSSTATAKTTGR